MGRSRPVDSAQHRNARGCISRPAPRDFRTRCSARNRALPPRREPGGVPRRCAHVPHVFFSFGNMQSIVVSWRSNCRVLAAGESVCCCVLSRKTTVPSFSETSFKKNSAGLLCGRERPKLLNPWWVLPAIARHRNSEMDARCKGSTKMPRAENDLTTPPSPPFLRLIQ